MLIADIGLVANAMTVLNAPPDLIKQVVTLLENNSEQLGSQVVTAVSPGWFGGSTTGHRFGVNTTMAHQAVEEEFQKLADSLREYSSAIMQWAEEVRDVDGTTDAEMTMRTAALEQVSTTLDAARDDVTSTTMGDGRYTDPTATEGGA